MINSDGRDNDRAGTGVALSGSTVVMGVPLHDIGTNADQGAAYVFTAPGLPVALQNTFSDLSFSLSEFSALAIHGDLAVVGSSLALPTGAVNVYQRSNDQWTLQTTLTASDGQVPGFDFFGASVATNGERIVVGAPYKNSNRGAAYVFVRDANGWREESRLTAEDGAAGDEFGTSVALDETGQLILVGAPLDDLGSRIDEGSAYVFRRNPGWKFSEKIIAPTSTTTDHLEQEKFGFDVSLEHDRDGWTALIGAPFARLKGLAAEGGAYVFTHNGTGNWQWQTRLTAADKRAGDGFGWSVALSGDTALIGAPDLFVARPQVGAAYVFTRFGAAWLQQAKLTASDNNVQDHFGSSVALSADMAIVGAPYGWLRPAFALPGAAVVFTRTRGSWTQQTRLTAPTPINGDGFGTAVAISNGTAVMNSLGAGPSTNAGKVYFYAPCRFALTPESADFAAAGGTGSFTVTCPNNCGWGAVGLPDWIRINGTSLGTGNGTVSFSVTANTGTRPRTASISVSSSSFVVTQAGSCATTLNPSVLPGGVVNAAYSQNLTLSSGIALNYRLANDGALPPGLTLSFNGALLGTPAANAIGTYQFTVVAAEPSGCVATRTYTLEIHACGVTLPSTSQSVNAVGGLFTFALIAVPSVGCSWNATSNEPWLQLRTTSPGTGNANLNYRVLPNFTTTPRVGVIVVNNRLFTVTQAAASRAASANAASYSTEQFAAESIVAAFGTNLATETLTARTVPLPTELAGTTVRVIDSQSVERSAPLFFVSPAQVNYLMPPGVANGPATVYLTGTNGNLAVNTVTIANVSPGMFTANATGNGVAAAQVLRVKPNGQQIYENVARVDQATGRIFPVPIDLTIVGDQVFLVLYGTGWRRRSALTAVNLRLANTALNVAYAGTTSLAGLDQINALLPTSFAGRGELDLTLAVDGKTTNTVKLTFR